MSGIIALALMLTAVIGTSPHIATEFIRGRIEKIDTKNKTIICWNSRIGAFAIKTDTNSLIRQDGRRVEFKDIIISSELSGIATKQFDGLYYGKEIELMENTLEDSPKSNTNQERDVSL
ncbi:MAG: hypothetical protein KA140_08095 [Caldisericia bacterium]|nr:hypothetical protein [Caldisericia bacterium]